MFERASTSWTPAAVLLALALPATAQKTETEIKADLDFARGLATEWSFMDLAENVLESIEAEGVSSSMEGTLARTKCDMYAAAAINERDNVRRIELFDSALAAYKTLITRSFSSEGNEDYNLETSYVDTAAKAIIAYDRALEEATGEQASQLTEGKLAMLEGAITQTNDIVKAVKAQLSVEPTNSLRRNLWTIWRNGAKISTEYAVMNNNNEFDIKRSETFLEEMVFDAMSADSVPNQMLAYIGLGEHYTRIGQPEFAIDYYMGVVEETIPSDRQTWETMKREGEFTQADVATRFIFLQRSIDGLMNACIQAGRKQDAARYAAHFYNIWKGEGMDLDPPGYMSLLACSAAFLEFGGYIGGDQNRAVRWYDNAEDMEKAHSKKRDRDTAVSFALRLARTVGENNRGNVLQLRAQKLVSNIISRPGVAVSPELLYEAARGEYFEDNFTAALDGYRRLLRELDSQDEAAKITYGAKVMNGMGNCFRKLNRPLEAALAFREGAVSWSGDAEFDEQNANGFYRMAQQVERSATGNADPLAALVAEAESVVANVGGRNQDQVLYNLAQKHQNNEDWDRAITEYRKIERGSDYWEPAQAQIGVVKFKNKDATGALETFEEYLNGYLKDPVNADPGTDAKRARRAEAKATAEIYRGVILSSTAKRSGNEGDHRKVIETLSTFPQDNPGQDGSAAIALKFVLDSQLALTELEAARQTLERMISGYPDANSTRRAGTAFAAALEGKLKASTDAEEQRNLRQQLAEVLKLGNGPDSPFPNLRNESKYWLALGNWKEAERVLQSMATRFGSDPQRLNDLRNYVLPDLAEALVAQRRLGEAKGVLDPVVQAEDFKASKRTLRIWSSAITGWLEGKGSSIVEIPGAGGTIEEYEKVAESLNSIEPAYDKWIDCEWYVIKFEVAYAYYRASEEHSSQKKDALKRVMSPIEGEVGKRFDQISDFCTDGEEDNAAVVARYGNDVLRDHYRWLNDKL